ncbi:MAG: hypothetical protein A3F67_05875 [Verrucomicrobia bacterium RIFCSPHIGHO2_12_FULL_41_10]|nr:MAG: hypothetical protein A3F67_05875 [Verrucomicrobia bacterium RIFCSPHIGHO2_12_FULL_41_10]
MENHYFKKLLKRVARSFYLTICLLPKVLREPIGLAYLLARASDTIADQANLSYEEREQVLRLLKELLEEGKDSKNFLLVQSQIESLVIEFQDIEKDLLLSLPTLLHQLYSKRRSYFECKAIVTVWQHILEGQLLDQKWNQVINLDSRAKHSVNPSVKCDRGSTDHQNDLSNFDRRIHQPTAYSLQPTASIRPVSRIVTNRAPHVLSAEELDRYLYLVAGSVGEFWTKLSSHYFSGFSKESTETMREWGIAYGKGLQLTNILRDRKGDQRSGRFYCEESQVPELIDQALTYLQQGRFYVQTLSHRRLRYASVLPLLIAEQTLALILKSPNEEGIKVSRWCVYLTLLRALSFWI